MDIDPRGVRDTLAAGASAPSQCSDFPAMSDDGTPIVLQPLPSIATTIRLLLTWHWGSAGQHFTASRAREQILQEMHELSYLSTIYLLVIVTLAVTGIPSGGDDVHPKAWRRDVWACLWAADFFLMVQVAVLAFYMFCAVNGCDDDAEVLRFLDSLDTLAVLPHRLFTLGSIISASGLLWWLYMDFRIITLYVLSGIFAVFIGFQVVLEFQIVRASVSSKARPVEGPQYAAALRRAASRANLAAMLPPDGLEGPGGGPQIDPAREKYSKDASAGAALRRTAMRHASTVADGVEVTPAAGGRHVHFPTDTELGRY